MDFGHPELAVSSSKLGAEILSLHCPILCCRTPFPKTGAPGRSEPKAQRCSAHRRPPCVLCEASSQSAGTAHTWSCVLRWPQAGHVLGHVLCGDDTQTQLRCHARHCLPVSGLCSPNVGTALREARSQGD